MRAGMRVESAFHAMMSRDRRALAHQIVMHDARPDEVVGAQQLERARHLPGREIALLAHDVLEEGELALVDEERELASFLEICLGRKEAERRKALPVLRRLAPCQAPPP